MKKNKTVEKIEKVEKATKVTKITKTNILSLAKKVAVALQDKKALDVIVLDVRGKSDITDFFVLATGMSTTHIKSLPGYVNDEMAKAGIRPLRREGIIKDTKWSVLDYGFVIVHIFTKEMRDEYRIESIWGDAKKVKLEEEAIAEK
jgi:ribosome-associated protein